MYQFFLLLRDFVKCIGTLPTWLKAFFLLLYPLLLLCGYVVYKIPDTAPVIRALREQPVQQPLPPYPDQVAGVK